MDACLHCLHGDTPPLNTPLIASFSYLDPFSPSTHISPPIGAKLA